MDVYFVWDQKNLFSSQNFLWNKFTSKVRFVRLFECETLFPTMAFLPVIWQIFDISVKLFCWLYFICLVVSKNGLQNYALFFVCASFFEKIFLSRFYLVFLVLFWTNVFCCVLFVQEVDFADVYLFFWLFCLSLRCNRDF